MHCPCHRVGNSILGSVCAAEKAALVSARALGPEKAQAAIAAADEGCKNTSTPSHTLISREASNRLIVAAAWFCCCPSSCEKETWTAQMWELGLVPVSAHANPHHNLTTRPKKIYLTDCLWFQPWDNHTVTGANKTTGVQIAELEAFKWPLLECPTQFAHAREWPANPSMRASRVCVHKLDFTSVFTLDIHARSSR